MNTYHVATSEYEETVEANHVQINDNGTLLFYDTQGDLSAAFSKWLVFVKANPVVD